MPLDPSMLNALNDQVNAELSSAYIYLGMSASAAYAGFLGSANWFTAQSQEEMVHAMKIMNFIIDRGGEVELKSISAPGLPEITIESISTLPSLQAAHVQEVIITGSINDLVALSLELGDYATYQMLQWFVREQVEEENSVREKILKLQRAEASGTVFLVEQELGTRPVLYTMPVTAL